MNTNYDRARSALVEISKEIKLQVHDKSCLYTEWEGADVVITSNNSKGKGNEGFDPELRTLITPYACEVGWLFTRLRNAFDELLDGTSKNRFYGRLADAATNYQQNVNGDETSQDMLKAVLSEAFIVLDEIEEGKFGCSLLAPSGKILADLIDEAERNGYLGPQAINEFLRQMEQKHREA